jgi:hypothetical protein
MICNDVATATNTIAIGVNNTAVGLPAAGAGTVCGNGIREAFEECDNGTVAAPANGHATGNANGDLTAGGCSTICRCNNDFVGAACN